MDKKHHRYSPWSDEELQMEALKYRTRKEFENGSFQEYKAACRRGQPFLDKICSHMSPAKGPSIAEKELMLEIRKVFPEAKKIHITKLKINNRPHIKRFEVDIFISSLMKGIEYDGDHYHSFEYMRKDEAKKYWSDEDIRDYHEIKDAAFLSRGIEILHIKERDWNKDKESCVQKCLDFLGGSNEQQVA